MSYHTWYLTRFSAKSIMARTSSIKPEAIDYLTVLVVLILFIWPFLTMGYVHAQLWLQSVSPVAIQPQRAPQLLEENVLDKHGLSNPSPVPAEQKMLFAKFHMSPEGIDSLSFEVSCEGANVSHLTARGKRFSLKGKNPASIVACFPAQSMDSVFASNEADIGENSNHKQKNKAGANAYFVVVYGVKGGESYLVAFKSTKSEAHVLWAPLEQKLPE